MTANGSEVIVRKWVFRPAEHRVEACLGPTEAARAAAISDERRRQGYVRSRSLLRRVLAFETGGEPKALSFVTDARGKPRLDGLAAPGFSISHSGAWLVVAVASVEVGVDVETHDPRLGPLRIARRFFSPSDVRALEAAADVAAGFRRQWVAKEAAAKAAGTGLADHLERAECEYGGDRIRAVRWAERRFAIADFGLADGTPGAVAVAAPAVIRLAEGAAEALLS